MAAENGFVTIAFAKQENNLSALSGFIAEKLAFLQTSGQYLPDEVCEWSFLEGWNAGSFDLTSQLVTYDSIDCVKAFCKEIVTTFPELGFGGTLYHDWVITNSSPTQITFMHEKGTKSLLWQSMWWDSDTIMDAMDSEGEPDGWSGNINDLPATKINHWMWDVEAGKVKKLTSDADMDYYAEFLKQL